MSEACQAVNNVTRKAAVHVSRKGVWRMCDQPEGPLGKEGAPLMIRSYKGLQDKGLQSRSATASMLIINYQCMKEEI